MRSREGEGSPAWMVVGILSAIVIMFAILSTAGSHGGSEGGLAAGFRDAVSGGTR